MNRTAVAAAASFVVAALAEAALPVFYNPQRGTTFVEAQFFFISLGQLLAGPDAGRLAFIVGFSLPTVCTIAGLVLWTRAGRLVAVARFVCAAAALGALTFAHAQIVGDWLFGLYAIEASLAVGVVASGLRLWAEVSFRDVVRR